MDVWRRKKTFTGSLQLQGIALYPSIVAIYFNIYGESEKDKEIEGDGRITLATVDVISSFPV